MGKVINIQDEQTKLIYDDEEFIIKNGKEEVKLSYHHDQDCCECVYADFSVIKYYEEQISKKLAMGNINSVEIRLVKEMGFLLILRFGDTEYRTDDRTIKILIPCYNEQNGYYNDALDLIVTHKINKSEEIEETIDLRNYKEDNEY